ncbi:MAG: hypothetical protein V4733_07145 [Verrucomicrobiota bacterium]
MKKLIIRTMVVLAGLACTSCGMPGALARTAGAAVRTVGNVAGM